MDIWTYRPHVGRVDVTGFDVEAVDGAIGSVDEATLEVGESYLVVDTGKWIFGKKVLLPAGLVDNVDRDEETVHVGRTKEEIKAAPEFDTDRYRESAYRDKITAYYQAPTVAPVGDERDDS